MERRHPWGAVARAMVMVLGAGTLAGPPALGAEAPRLLAMPEPVEANAEHQWMVGVRLVNPRPVGIYIDSVFCDVEEIAPAPARPPRRETISLYAVRRVLPSISANDSGTFNAQIPVHAVRARLNFRLYAHDFDGKKHVLKVGVTGEPGLIARQYPSTLLDCGGRKVEVVVMPALGDGASAPAILLVHGDQGEARLMFQLAERLWAGHYTVMMVSQPGFGQSEGKADFAGPATLRALSCALDSLKRTPGVDSSRVAAWGISRGATAVLELAAQRKDLKAVIAQAGFYDLWAVHRGTAARALREAIVQEAGSDSAGWRERSPILAADQVHGDVLLVHGEQDQTAPIAQARSFHAVLRERGIRAESRFSPEGEHELHHQEVLPIVIEFLRPRMTK